MTLRLSGNLEQSDAAQRVGALHGPTILKSTVHFVEVATKRNV